MDQNIFSTESILIIDDEESILKLNKKVLENHGYQVITAGSGEEGVERFKQCRDQIDLVLLDIGMPGKGGIKCMQEIIQDDPNAKIILMSGYSENDQIEAAMGCGTKAFLAKPCSLLDLLRTVREILNSP